MKRDSYKRRYVKEAPLTTNYQPPKPPVKYTISIVVPKE